MRPLTVVEGQAVSLPEANVDTDIIYPARFLLITEKKGLGAYAFADRRVDRDFPIQADNMRPILIAGPNFGCGSSREQAPWALDDLRFRVLIAESFGEIFYGNCFRNGILPVRLDAGVVAALRDEAERDAVIRVNLVDRRVSTQAHSIPFDIADDRREALLNGWNDTQRILALHGDDIVRFEEGQRRAASWLWTKEDMDR